ncbi:ribonuclease H-like domain-containing protein [Tanacetum coccineum]
MWIECILIATYLINRLPSSVLNGKSLYELIYKKSPTFSHFRVFGCLCFAAIINSNDKLGSKYEKRVMIEYSNVKKEYRLYNLEKHQFIYSRDVKFFESVFPFKESVTEKTNTTSNIFQDLNHINFFDNEYPKRPIDDERVDLSPNSENSSQSDCSYSSDKQVDTLEDNNNSEGNLDQNPNSFTQDVQNLRRSSKPSVFPRNYNDFVIDSKVKYDLEKYSHWTGAMNNEIDALLRNDTWKITELPKGGKAIGSKWVFRIKYKSNGEIDIYKARLIAKGYNQKEDLNNAFLYGDLVETVYMKLPGGYFSANDNRVCRLTKFLYGLKQAPRQWNAKLTAALVENGFIRNLGKLKYFLGIELIDTDKGIFLNKRKYVLDLLSEYMLACKPTKIPLQSKLVIINEATTADHLLDNISDYQKLIGKLIYLTNTTPDISYVVHCLSHIMHSPLKSHLKIAFKILRYLKGSLYEGTEFNKNNMLQTDVAACLLLLMGTHKIGGISRVDLDVGNRPMSHQAIVGSGGARSKGFVRRLSGEREGMRWSEGLVCKLVGKSDVLQRPVAAAEMLNTKISGGPTGGGGGGGGSRAKGHPAKAATATGLVMFPQPQRIVKTHKLQRSRIG